MPLELEQIRRCRDSIKDAMQSVHTYMDALQTTFVAIDAIRETDNFEDRDSNLQEIHEMYEAASKHYAFLHRLYVESMKLEDKTICAAVQALDLRVIDDLH